MVRSTVSTWEFPLTRAITKAFLGGRGSPIFHFRTIDLLGSSRTKEWMEKGEDLKRG